MHTFLRVEVAVSKSKSIAKRPVSRRVYLRCLIFARDILDISILVKHEKLVSFLPKKLTVRFQKRPRKSTPLINPQMFFFSISDKNDISRDIDEKPLKLGYVVSFLPEKLTVRFQNRPRESTPLINPQMDFFSDFRLKRYFSRYQRFCRNYRFFSNFSSLQLFFLTEAPKYLENRVGYALFFLALSLPPWSEDHLDGRNSGWIEFFQKLWPETWLDKLLCTDHT